MRMRRFNPKWIEGRTIVSVDMRPFGDRRGGTAHDPHFTLDNGARIWFVPEETDTGENGTAIGYAPPPKRRRKA